MKIEMGESLMLSWAKHVKHCQIATLNWKCSKCWDSFNYDKIYDIIAKINNEFPDNIFGKATSAEQIIGQAELDVLGINVDNHTINEIYAIDIAFHENGLLYSNNLNKITEKMLRSALVLYSVFNLDSGNIVFASPKVNPRDVKPLTERTEYIERFMNSLGFNFKFLFICNQDFYEQIFKPVQDASKQISDTSELFMRAMQLSALSDKCKPCQTSTHIYNQNNTQTTSDANVSGDVKKEYFMHGRPCSSHQLETHLRTTQSCDVFITVYYTNKPAIQRVWHVSHFTESSSLNGNLSSGVLRGWREKQITGIKVEIK